MEEPPGPGAGIFADGAVRRPRHVGPEDALVAESPRKGRDGVTQQGKLFFHAENGTQGLPAFTEDGRPAGEGHAAPVVHRSRKHGDHVLAPAPEEQSSPGRGETAVRVHRDQPVREGKLLFPHVRRGKFGSQGEDTVRIPQKLLHRREMKPCPEAEGMVVRKDSLSRRGQHHRSGELLRKEPHRFSRSRGTPAGDDDGRPGG
ncbi:hypothetical protein SDC9_47552 [bioreactor metagenome]|uniref:Uncharacterized protein n=1 Tax=bioreactor metagenome TaxID=1076179 RepID=A0A644WFL9_9ZZZZ